MSEVFISYYIDTNNHIIGLCPNDMSGNSDWYTTTIQALGLSMDDELYDDKGACLYKLENGAAVLRTEEERKEDWLEDPTQSSEDRIAALENELTAAKILLGILK